MRDRRTQTFAELPNFVEAVRRRAAEKGAARAFTFLADSGEETGHLTYAGLDAAARAVAALLQERQAAGERVLLLYPPGLDFIAGFLGCLYAGAVAVPAYPPRAGRGVRGIDRVAGILEDARPRLALTTAALRERVRQALAPAADADAVEVLATDGLPGDLADGWRPPGIAPGDLAFLQYTSGSTAAPKGVMVTHAHLIANERAIEPAFEQSEESVVAGWLPLYHDMGLIGNVLQPLWCGGRAVLMSPLAFLQRPRLWLETITRHRATTAGGPDFAYQLCCRRIGPEERQGLDLASWRVAFNGAEPVRPETLERFAAAFAPCGFRREAFYPCYGLAEATLFVAGGAVAAPPVVRPVSAAALGQGRAEVLSQGRAEVLSQGRAEPVAGGEPARLLAGCGRAWPGERIAVVDPDSCRILPPRRVGEIWVAGPSVAAGYWRRPEETARTFGAALAGGAGPWLRTGDLGWLDEDGELFVTGRIKDLIVARGRNVYPHDLERTAEASHPALRPGGGAAFALEVEGEERVVIVHEIERRREAEAGQAAAAVRRAVLEEHEVDPWAVVAIRAGTLPKTSSGKVRRAACRDAFVAGRLEVVARLGGDEDIRANVDSFSRAGPPSPAKRAPAQAVPRSASIGDGGEGLPGTARRAALEASIREHAARVLRVDPATLEPERPLPLESLAAVEIKNRLEANLGAAPPLAVFLDGASLRRLAEETARALAAGDAGLPAPRRYPPAFEHPLSHNQRSLWFVHGLDPESGAYNLAFAARLRTADGGPADTGELRRALEQLAERHPALRATYAAPQGEPVQRISDSAAIDFAAVDGTGWSEGQLAERLAEEARLPFDLERGPALRARLVVTRAEQEPVLLLAVHHISADFWSLVVLLEDLGRLYRRESAGKPPALAYTDYVHWQRELLAGPAGERLWAWWREALAGCEGEAAVLDLPADRPRPPSLSYRGGSQTLFVEPAVVERLRTAGAGATLFVAVLAAFQALLGRYTGRDDLLVGSPASGRSRAEFEEVVGYFANQLPLRADLRGDPPFQELLARTRRTVAGVLEHQDFPFPLLVERLQPVRDPARPPLVQVGLALEKAHRLEEAGVGPFLLGREGAVLRLGDLSLQTVALPRRVAQLDVVLMAVEAEGGLAVRLDYNADLFDDPTGGRIAGHFATLLAAAAADPERRLSELPLLSAAERAQIEIEWNDTSAAPPPPRRLDELFREQAARTPEASAVDDGCQRWTYRELAERAARLAEHLRRLGVGPEVAVALHLDRSAPLVAAVLATLEAGGTYVPLDPEYPRERLEFFLEDSGAAVLLTAAAPGHEPRANNARTVFLNLERLEGGGPAMPSGPAVRAWPENLAYLLYTSGSTGTPKAVGCPHPGVVNHVVDLAGRLPLGPGDRCCWWTSPGFDPSVWEIFTTLLSGAALVVAPAAVRSDGRRLAAWLERERIVSVFAPPFFLPDFVDHVDAGGTLALRWILTGLETIHLPLLAGLVRRVPGLQIVDAYGPTEATIYTTLYKVGPNETRNGRTPIGRPIRNAAFHVLDRSGRPVPIGVPGEVWLGGVCLGRGYHGRPDRTADQFRPDPFSAEPGARLYRTGDLARLLPDGNADFLGRGDRQIKLRGLRIELGEIDAALRDHPAVREAVTVLREGRIVAYTVPSGREPTDAELRRFLAQRLPDPMIPSAFVSLPEIPVTVHGKLDRRRLPAPPAPSETAGRAPRSELERRIAEVWCQALGRERVGADDNFFELGGHSLLLARVQARLTESLGREISMVELLSHPTVAALAAALAANAADAAETSGTDGDSVPERSFQAPGQVKQVFDRAAARRSAMGGRRSGKGSQEGRPR